MSVWQCEFSLHVRCMEKSCFWASWWQIWEPLCDMTVSKCHLYSDSDRVGFIQVGIAGSTICGGGWRDLEGKELLLLPCV